MEDKAPSECGPAPSVAHATHHNTGTAATYTCDQGYELASGEATIICLESGEWSTNTLVCTGRLR